MALRSFAVLALICSMVPAAFANKHRKEMEAAAEALPECTKIASECRAAGYMPGDHKRGGRGLWADCVHAVSVGKAVTGVSETKEGARACAKAARAYRKGTVTGAAAPPAPVGTAPAPAAAGGTESH